jgi:hypothetical protein
VADADNTTDEVEHQFRSSEIDTSKPLSARVWNYWLGGKDFFPVDRELGDMVVQADPQIVAIARESRATLTRIITYLARDAGIRQFLDLGSGLPADNNVHEVAQRIAPESRVVYVDNDPVVMVHARALLVGTPEGATSYLELDARDTDKVLAGAAATLDFTKPVALVLFGILGAAVPDTSEAYGIAQRLIAAVPSGSYLALNDGTHGADKAAEASAEGGYPYTTRSPEEIARYFDGTELVPPGVVSTPLWRPEAGSSPTELGVHCGVGRKP